MLVEAANDQTMLVVLRTMYLPRKSELRSALLDELEPAVLGARGPFASKWIMVMRTPMFGRWAAESVGTPWSWSSDHLLRALLVRGRAAGVFGMAGGGFLEAGERTNVRHRSCSLI